MNVSGATTTGGCSQQSSEIPFKIIQLKRQITVVAGFNTHYCSISLKRLSVLVVGKATFSISFDPAVRRIYIKI